jgi:hypothetical protein
MLVLLQFLCSFIIATMVFSFNLVLPLLGSSFPVVLASAGLPTAAAMRWRSSWRPKPCAKEDGVGRCGGAGGDIHGMDGGLPVVLASTAATYCSGRVRVFLALLVNAEAALVIPVMDGLEVAGDADAYSCRRTSVDGQDKLGL